MFYGLVVIIPFDNWLLKVGNTLLKTIEFNTLIICHERELCFITFIVRASVISDESIVSFHIVNSMNR